MFFDDRLATVLRQRATGEASLRTQYRQLLDLLGKDRRDGYRCDHGLLAAAWLRMDALGEDIPASARARMIREPGWRFRSPDLAAHLADQEPEIASAALSRAELSSDDWTALIPRLPMRARGFLRLRRDLPVDAEALLARLGVHDRGLPAPAAVSQPAQDNAAPDAQRPAPPTALPIRPRMEQAGPVRTSAPTPISAPTRMRNRDDTGRTEISALVERIAQFRRARGDSPLDLERSPRLPLGELSERPGRVVPSFGFAADTAGRIVWATTEVAPMVVGTKLYAAQQRSDESTDSSGLARAFARRQPISRGAISLIGAPAITGDWLVDAEPRFSEDGHFTGYFGRFRRTLDPSAQLTRPEAREADRIRQLLHELRTPVTAVQGYAEVIQQQLFGPAPHEYRALAAAIAADAARILAGFEELERLARLETGATTIEPGETDLAALARRMAAQLGSVLEPEGAGLSLAFPDTMTMLVAIDPDDAEGLLWRLLASLASACAPGEQMSVRLEPLMGPVEAAARLVCAIPARLAEQDNLFAATTRASANTINAGLFGAGFALRLARAEARAAGGDLLRAGAELILTLPLLGTPDDMPDGLRDTGKRVMQ